MRKPIVREKHGKGFAYFAGDEKIADPAQLARIKSLAIPPAWHDVEISPSPRAKVQATGYDNAGRRQAIYSASYRSKQSMEKYAHIVSFAAQLPALRQQLDHDLAKPGLPKEKILACVVTLISEAYFRVGNDTYAREHQSYGITTLRSKHANIRGDTITFHFNGKSGQTQYKSVNDKTVARIVRKLDELPGYEIFQYVDEDGGAHRIRSHDVNAYIKAHMGDAYTAKDFRTWAGTLLAAIELAANERPDTKNGRKKAVTACIKKVARQLGNTPAITRSSYIDPRVIAAYHGGDELAKIKKALGGTIPKRYQKPEEVCLIDLLKTK